MGRISLCYSTITTGMHADYFTVAARTDPTSTGQQGISLILVERSRAGVKTEKMHLQGNWCGGTAVVTFEDVLVPTTNLIGVEHEGFRTIMRNFNHERFVIAVIALRSARLCLSESVRRARLRKTFGKPLAHHQVIRHKIADMAMGVEQCQAFCESVAFQMQSGTLSEAQLGRLVSLFKVSASRYGRGVRIYLYASCILHRNVHPHFTQHC